MAEPRAASRIAPLDSLRGIAILMVLAAHFWPARLTIPALDDVVGSFGAGGVLLFFLLSGYLIFRNVQRQPLPVFLERRLFKLMPAYWLNMAAVMAAGYALAGQPRFLAGTYLANAFLIPDVTRSPLVNDVYWTLVIEIKFYVLIAVQYRLLRDRHLLAVPLAIAACNLVFWAWTGRGSVLLSYLPVFYIGIEIYRAEAGGWSRAGCTRLAAVTIGVAASLALFIPDAAWVKVAHTLVAAFLFVVVLTCGWQAGWLNFFGRISYSLYLFHPTLGFPIVAALAGTAVPPLAAAAAAAAASIIAAAVLFYAIEGSGVRAGRMLENRPLAMRYARSINPP